MVQAGEQTLGTRSKNKNNVRITGLRNKINAAQNAREYSAGRRPGSGKISR